MHLKGGRRQERGTMGKIRVVPRRQQAVRQKNEAAGTQHQGKVLSAMQIMILLNPG